jgi:hypothetical protein
MTVVLFYIHAFASPIIVYFQCFSIHQPRQGEGSSKHHGASGPGSAFDFHFFQEKDENIIL